MFSEFNVKSNRFISKTLEKPIKNLGAVKGVVTIDFNESPKIKAKLIGDTTFVVSPSDNNVIPFESATLEIVNDNYIVSFSDDFTLNTQYKLNAYSSNILKFDIVKLFGKYNYKLNAISYKSIISNDVFDSSKATANEIKQLPYNAFSVLAANRTGCCNASAFIALPSCGYYQNCYVGPLQNFTISCYTPSYEIACSSCTVALHVSPMSSSYTGKYRAGSSYTVDACCYNCCCMIALNTLLYTITDTCDSISTIYGGGYCNTNAPMSSSSTMCLCGVVKGVDDDRNIFTITGCYNGYISNGTYTSGICLFRTKNPSNAKDINVLDSSCRTICNQYCYDRICISSYESYMFMPKIFGWSDRCTFLFGSTVSRVQDGTSCITGTYTYLYRNICPTSYPACYVCQCIQGSLLPTLCKNYFVAINNRCTGYSSSSKSCFNLTIYCDCNYFNCYTSPCLQSVLSATISQGNSYAGDTCADLVVGISITCDMCYVLISHVGYCCTSLYCQKGFITVYCKCAGSSCYCSSPSTICAGTGTVFQAPGGYQGTIIDHVGYRDTNNILKNIWQYNTSNGQCTAICFNCSTNTWGIESPRTYTGPMCTSYGCVGLTNNINHCFCNWIYGVAYNQMCVGYFQPNLCYIRNTSVNNPIKIIGDGGYYASILCICNCTNTVTTYGDF